MHGHGTTVQASHQLYNMGRNSYELEGVKDLSVKHEKYSTANSSAAFSPSVDLEDGEVPDTSSDNQAPEEVKTAPNVVSPRELFRYADRLDVFLMVVGLTMATIHGVLLIFKTVLVGALTNDFVNDARFSHWLDEHWDNVTKLVPNVTKNDILDDPADLRSSLKNYNRTDLEGMVQDDALMDKITQYAMYFSIMGVSVLVLGYIQVYCTKVAAARQALRIRSKLFAAILRQDMGWFDTHDSGELGSRMTQDILRIEAGIGDGASYAVQSCVSGLTAVVVGFLFGWQLSLLMLCGFPIFATIIGVMSKFAAKMSTQQLKAYAKAGAIAEEVLSAMRTVTAFGGQQKEVDRYGNKLVDARRYGIKKGLVVGGGIGCLIVMLLSFNALVLGYGCKLVIDGQYESGDVMVVFLCLLIGTNNLSSVGPSLQDFAEARAGAYVVYGIIGQEPHIDSTSEEGLKPGEVVGDIEFHNVVFCYPSRPQVSVLEGLSSSVHMGQTVALVGASGCGKSTAIQLLLRFYDPLQGAITLDGNDLKELNIKWLRQNIGLVSQEPVLFDTSISANIALGSDDVTRDEIEAAAKQANAHDFIMELPQQYDTLVGERGTQLSGGQKQRVAIARALVRDPRILLLDEATSALDNESESIVQAALDKARQGRTTIVIAHRLSTIKTADVIVGIQDGVVKEQGTHDELMEKQGIYFQLVTNQSKGDKEALSTPQPPEHETAQTHMKDVSEDETVFTALEEKVVIEEAPIKRIMRLNSTEWPFILVGCVAAAVMGCFLPCFAYLIGEIIRILTVLDEDQQEEDTIFYAMMFVLLGILAGLAAFTKNYMFAISGEKLTQRLRQLAFKSLLRQDVSYFDEPCHTTGTLTAWLAVDASIVQGATGIHLSMMLESLSAMVVGLTIVLILSWKLTLLILAFMPFIMISTVIRTRAERWTKINDKRRATSNQGSDNAGKISTEVIENISTVASLTKEDKFFKDYHSVVNAECSTELKAAHLEAFGYGFAQSIIYFTFAAIYTMGAYLVRTDGMEFHNVFRVMMTTMFSVRAAAQGTAYGPNYSKAKLAAARMFSLFDKEPEINITSEAGDQLEQIEGNVEFHNVTFCYPTRPNAEVLRNTNMSVKAGQMVALVGSSGCGKSTVVQLLERFYDPLAGCVTIDGHKLTELHLQWIRQQMGIVSQEPVLFNRTIQENIAYGDNARDVAMAEIVAAAKDANVHNFISSLPNGYDTNVGEKGVQLSGGQKQRVAIARALVRNPKILILDEATSALDTESEKIVQEALDKAQEGRTSIVIAHRLSTIQHADCIVVISNGQVAELGTHGQLMSAKGVYYTLHQAQHRRS